MIPFLLAATEAATGAAETGGQESSGLSAVGLSPSAFVIQLITFVIVFALLKKFAFNRIVRMLEERRKVIDDGVKLGQELEREKAKVDAEIAKVMREARHDADKIIATGHKEAREVIREAEKTAQRKAESIIADAEVRITEESEQARRRLEKELVGLVSEATEAIVEEKVDPERDAKLIEKAMKGRKN